RCAFCRKEPADTEIAVDGETAGYVCKRCLRVTKRRGIRGLQRFFRFSARQHQRRADDVARLNADADCLFKLAIHTDTITYGHDVDYTAAGPIDSGIAKKGGHSR